MEGDFIKINKWLLPLSWLYGAGVSVRNTLFESNVLKSRSFDIPIVAVGNITVGGAGKTPHVEYLVELLRDEFKVAVLSRGYKRKTHGYQLANSTTQMHEIGDEPYQMLHKYAGIHVAVDANRCRGIERLITDTTTNDTEVVLLDDAFQHRYVKPGVNILLVDYHRLIVYDRLLPAGRLREPQNGKNRADIVIITKCPDDLKPMNFRVLQRAMSLYPYQQLYFTTLDHGPLKPLFPDGHTPPLVSQLDNVLLVTGIASPEQMTRDLKAQGVKHLQNLRFADHHQFTPSDVEAINMAYKMMKKPAVVITTEKDATRLEHIKGLSREVRQNIFIQPIKIKFMQNDKEKFDNQIINYVRKHQRNSGMDTKPYDNQPANRYNIRNRTGTIGF